MLITMGTMRSLLIPFVFAVQGCGAPSVDPPDPDAAVVTVYDGAAPTDMALARPPRQLDADPDGDGPSDQGSPAPDLGLQVDAALIDVDAEPVADASQSTRDAELATDATPTANDAQPSDSALAAVDARPGVLDAAMEPRGPAFDEGRFAASHNSYEGGPRGSIRAQLEGGIRALEFDLHDDDFAVHGDYRVGHLWPGEAVSHDGDNPESARLSEWLEEVARWSANHEGHGPVTLILDLKDNLTDNPGPADGNLGALNAQLDAVFGARLAWAGQMETPWPTTDRLRGRIMVVLSGDRTGRQAYERDQGVRPAVAKNARGQVIEVHDSGRGTLWYWTGHVDADGHIEWHHHGRYAAGRRPAVHLTDGGQVMTVHQGAVSNRLFVTMGQLAPDGTVQWGDPAQYDTGVDPSLGVDDDGQLEEIHRSELTGQLWRWTVDFIDDAPVFSENERTESAPYPVDQSAGVRVFSVPDGGGIPGMLYYGTETVDQAPIRYRPMAFVEAQPGDPDSLADRARFRAAPAGAEDFVRRPGVVGRWWGVTEAHVDGYLPQIPATDTPFAPWYRDVVVDGVR